MADVSAPMHNGNIQHGEIENDVIENTLNGNELLNGNETGVVATRIIKKAKRQLRRSPGKESVTLVSAPNVNRKQPLSKNSRKSRNGRGRGEPKKGGAGGKGVWGAPGSELYEEGVVRDSHDPNYDSDSEDLNTPTNSGNIATTEHTNSYIVNARWLSVKTVGKEGIIVEKIAPELSLKEFEAVMEPVLLEYFEHGDTKEVQEDLSDLNLQTYKPKIIESAVSMALDRKAQHREMTSRLISDLYSGVFTSKEVADGFDSVLTRLSDLTIDTPEAPIIVGQFIARAVADDCLPPKYITGYKGKIDCPFQRSALDKADVLLSKKHGIVRLDNIWGTGGGRPVKYLVKQMVMLLKEYLSSGDMAEATRCLRELDVPHFHHELVYEATLIVLEDSTDRTREMMCELLKTLSDAVIVTPNQFIQGFRRVYDAMPDICLDVPNAYVLLEKFANVCHKEGILSSEILKDLPQRGRKRFVSEGDGGRVKDVTP